MRTGRQSRTKTAGGRARRRNAAAVTRTKLTCRRHDSNVKCFYTLAASVAAGRAPGCLTMRKRNSPSPKQTNNTQMRFSFE
ncbi:hypothetical protein EVAR_6725_1 [Eumeta japonica]|uniref:Uncharacterized protein n=1 Tax=Eumeta variegata TaxID=151549 RepID=A0A4C1V526_EUMVA|nr:hypothetical protein EVAR_6725_1 [Eumeta japonica]